LTLYQLQTTVDITAATRHVGHRRDTDLTIKTVLTETLGGAVIRPWSIARQNGPVLTIVGYSELSATEANQRRELALPSLQAAIGPVLGYELPAPQTGDRLLFSVRLQPTVRCRDKDGNRREVDAFLHRVEAVGDDVPSRETVYGEYLDERLDGAQIEQARVERFQIADRCRKSARSKAGFARYRAPDAVITGTLTVTDPDALLRQLGTGIGRQRAFGCGMLRLAPVPVRAVAA